MATAVQCNIVFQALMQLHGAGRGGHGATEDDEGSQAAATDQEDDDDHVRLINPVKVRADTLGQTGW